MSFMHFSNAEWPNFGLGEPVWNTRVADQSVVPWASSGRHISTLLLTHFLLPIFLAIHPSSGRFSLLRGSCTLPPAPHGTHSSAGFNKLLRLTRSRSAKTEAMFKMVKCLHCSPIWSQNNQLAVFLEWVFEVKCLDCGRLQGACEGVAD